MPTGDVPLLRPGRTEKRAQELLRAEQARAGDFKVRSDRLAKIESTNLVFQGPDAFYVFPKTIVRALDLKPGESPSYVVERLGSQSREGWAAPLEWLEGDLSGGMLALPGYRASRYPHRRPRLKTRKS